MSARIEVTPRVALIDVARAIQLSGFAPRAEVDVIARQRQHDGSEWESVNRFIADESGTVDLRTAAPVSGDYAGSGAQALGTYARLGALAPGFELAFHTRDAFDAQFAPLAEHVVKRAPRYAAITVRTPQWREIGERAAVATLPTVTQPGRTLVALPRFDTLLEFVR